VQKPKFTLKVVSFLVWCVFTLAAHAQIHVTTAPMTDHQRVDQASIVIIGKLGLSVQKWETISEIRIKDVLAGQITTNCLLMASYLPVVSTSLDRETDWIVFTDKPYRTEGNRVYCWVVGTNRCDADGFLQATTDNVKRVLSLIEQNVTQREGRETK